MHTSLNWIQNKRGNTLHISLTILLLILSATMSGYGQSSKSIHKVLGMLVHSIHGTDTVAFTGSYDIYLYDESEHNSSLFIQSRSKPIFSVTLNAEQLQQYSHIMVITHSNYSSPCSTKIHIPYKNNSKCMVDISHCDTISIIKYSPVKKPVIYIYPKQDQIIEVKHTYLGEITFTYPEYLDGWKVLAKTDGLLMNLYDSTQHRYLFWEGIANKSITRDIFNEGFIVKAKDIIPFLKKVLHQVGLNNLESNDFITFWAPRMMSKEECFIHFSINDNIRNTSFLEITPKPETLIRVFMEYSHEIPNNPIKEQELPSLKRNGYTVIEWGGTEIGTKIMN